ncbi:hypothetical protein UFOVP711_67 [uncultured Caudovirales phage]|uniref:Uncharacterized protein n=1 Tax=uncultured Caudovirales phage TaxID=2100421 RepID=A0A6J5NIU5_9CAUD|nr:hypothetical protein UFOVP711_67 [uncultured Caudovirales phage]
MSKCPRCGENRMTRHPALSRVDNKTHICTICGTDEAMLAFAGIALTKQSWHENEQQSAHVYHPFVLVDTEGAFGGGEILVAVFVSSSEVIVELSRRDDSSLRWSAPREAEAR